MIYFKVIIKCFFYFQSHTVQRTKPNAHGEPGHSLRAHSPLGPRGTGPQHRHRLHPTEQRRRYPPKRFQGDIHRGQPQRQEESVIFTQPAIPERKLSPQCNTFLQNISELVRRMDVATGLYQMQVTINLLSKL